MTLLLVTADYRILVTDTGEPAWLPLEAVDFERYCEALLYAPLCDAPEDFDPQTPTPASFPYLAVRATEAEQAHWTEKPGLRWATIRGYLHHPHVAEVVAQLRFREQYRFHPTTGEPLQHLGGTASGSNGRPIFPRIDPAVIGLVELAGQDKILLGRNRLRPDYFSLIAGYVGPGENLEQAWAREVLEETGRRVSGVTYWGSQPWPSSGSLMIALTGITHDEHAQQSTDNELVEIVWASREDLAQLPLATPGSIARTLIDWWVTHND